MATDDLLHIPDPSNGEPTPVSIDARPGTGVGRIDPFSPAIR